MNWNGKSILYAGLGLILASNLAALGGVGYNRMGEPDSALRLSQRELMRPYRWGIERESSGLAMILQWRLPVDEPKAGNGFTYYHAGGSAKWLDHAKLTALGFDATPPRGADESNAASRLLPREALLVLEFNGPAYQHALDVVRDLAAREQALQAANPGNEEMKRRAKMARDQAAREENEASRLFIIDAGPDAARLRAAYPDRTRYAIVRGEVRASWGVNAAGQPALSGQVDGILVDRIHVPHALLSGAAIGGARERGAAKAEPFEAVVNFGRRFEPWIVSAAGL